MEEASEAFYELHPLGTKQREITFTEGVLYADEHPKCPWISVEERLPEENKKVLICTKANNIFIANLYNSEWCGQSIRDYLLTKQDITHWTPIPELER